MGDLNARIRATVAGLDKANPEHFTAGGTQSESRQCGAGGTGEQCANQSGAG
ncbi:hypothetical protein AB2F92_21545 [Escherichia coli]